MQSLFIRPTKPQFNPLIIIPTTTRTSSTSCSLNQKLHLSPSKSLRFHSSTSLQTPCHQNKLTNVASCSKDHESPSLIKNHVRSKLELISEALSTAFPLWVSLACASALYRPSYFLWFDKKWQIFGLTLTMLGMGMTLTVNDLKGALTMPREVIIGFILQYTVMPFSGAAISRLLSLPPHYAAGLILVACCPGGTASNIVTYLARGNVALSVVMTAASTFSAVVMTPLLTAKLAGQFIAVDATGLLVSTVQVVLAPVLLGALLNQYCNSLVSLVSPFMPLLAVVTVAMLCGSSIGQNAAAVLASGHVIVLASGALHVSGFLFGFVLARLLGVDISSARTISIEVGMQNSVLGVVLAGQHFSNPLTAVPCAVSSVCHSIVGSLLAGFWRVTSPSSEDIALCMQKQ